MYQDQADQYAVESGFHDFGTLHPQKSNFTQAEWLTAQLETPLKTPSGNI